MGFTHFPHGLSSLGMPLMGGGPGTLPVMGGKIAGGAGPKIYFVDPANGSASNDGLNPNSAKAKVSEAYALTVDKSGDIIYLLSDGNITGSSDEDSTITWSNDNVHLLGLCAPTIVSQRARIAPTSEAAAANVTPQILVSGNSNIFANISLFEGGAEAAASTCITVTGERNYFYNVAMMNMGDGGGSSAATVATSNNLYLNGGSENTFQHCYIGLDTIARSAGNANVLFASAATRNLFEDCVFAMRATANSPIFLDADTANSLDRWTIFRRCLFVNAASSSGTTISEVANMHATSNGMFLMDNSFFVGATNWETAASGNVYMGMPIADSAGTDAGGILNAHT